MTLIFGFAFFAPWMYPLMNLTIAGHVVRADGADDLLAALSLELRAGEVADEISGLVLGEDDAGRVLRLLPEERVRLVDAGELLVREPRRDRVQRGVVEEADGEDRS